MKNYVLSKITKLGLVIGIFIQITQAMEEFPVNECSCRQDNCKTISIPTEEKVREEINNHHQLIEKPKFFDTQTISCAFVQNDILWKILASEARDPLTPVIFMCASYSGKAEVDYTANGLNGVMAEDKCFHVYYTIAGYRAQVSAKIPDFHLCPNLYKQNSGRNLSNGSFCFSFSSKKNHICSNFYTQDIILHCDRVMSLLDIAARSFVLEARKNMFNCQERHLGIIETITDKEYLANFRELYSEHSYLGDKIVELYFLLNLESLPEDVTDIIYKYMSIHKKY